MPETAPDAAPSPPEQPSEPTMAEGQQDDGTLWERVRTRLRDRFPIGIATILADDLQVSVRLIGDTLALATLNDFARNMVDHPDVLARLGALASETAGRSIRVQTTAPDAPELQRSASEINDRLEALRQFDIVQFIDHSTED